ncbi:MAG: polysaccharide pyruvyl transferase family protein [Bacteroidaceae bacterium]|nr:polysaccharide pyruvyl transferase family protein [Bacteroidaceae bacterium]
MSYLFYNMVMWLGKHLFRLVKTSQAAFSSNTSKFPKFALGQHNLLQSIQEEVGSCQKRKIWIHISSLGEHAVAYPLIKRLRSDNTIVVLTCFSPSAYEVLKERKDGANYVYYLPWDTHNNAKRFLDIVRPSKVIFVISEYWINYLRELNQRQIPTFFLSSLIPRDSYLLKWYGRPIRNAIPKNTGFMVIDENSKENLHQIGFDNVIVAGDPLFDNALSIADSPYEDEIVERFCSTATGGVFIAGSISDNKDLEIVSQFANSHRNVKCIFVPHEISEENLNKIKYHLDGWAELYSDCSKDTDFTKRQVLIIDFIGALSRLYRFGRWAYVGGGFTPYLHSVIEPIVYGLPVAFGPHIYRKTTPQQMIELGIGKMVKSPKEFNIWIDHLISDKNEMKRIKQTALGYAKSNSNATTRVVHFIEEGI